MHYFGAYGSRIRPDNGPGVKNEGGNQGSDKEDGGGGIIRLIVILDFWGTELEPIGSRKD